MTTKSGVSGSKMFVDNSKKRTVLKDNSWIRRAAEEDEPVDDDPNFGKAVLGRLKSVDDADSKPVETNQTPPVNSGTPVSSLTKKFDGSQDLLNKSSINTTNSKNTVSTPTSPAKPLVPAKNPALKMSPNPSSFTARVFSGANTSNKTLSPIKRSFGEKFPEATVPQTANGLNKTTSAGPSSVAPTAAVEHNVPSSPEPSTSITSSHTVKNALITTPVNQPAVKISTSNGSVSPSTKSSVPASPAPQTAPKPPSPAPSTTLNTSSTVKSDLTTSRVIQPAFKTSTRNEIMSSSSMVPTSSNTFSKTTITDIQTSSPMLEETRTIKPSERNLMLSDVSASSTYTSRSSVQNHSAPLDDLADTLFPTLSGTVQSQPVKSQTQVKFIDDQIPAASQTLYSPVQTTLRQSSINRSVSSRDVCTVCGKPIAGAPRMILEDLNIFSHTSCFRCSVCNCVLGNLEAGKSLWVHRDRVNCLTCYSKIKGQWYA
ncbi:zinc finger protein 185-like [Myxocyprinus asiaticus]|uniref:zinc finger protein 185-like n=1 Tax=Myxocyprinus asiaticus TaxID=70543 RepID=UPI002222FBFB|nr:zinc finger protein 185-like [Myxocyprinus asiaticus]